eukprot:2422026-Pyramimonas_sp.AAC.1
MASNEDMPPNGYDLRRCGWVPKDRDIRVDWHACCLLGGSHLGAHERQRPCSSKRVGPWATATTAPAWYFQIMYVKVALSR